MGEKETEGERKRERERDREKEREQQRSTSFILSLPRGRQLIPQKSRLHSGQMIVKTD
jgi:hypothetical protein